MGRALVGLVGFCVLAVMAAAGYLAVVGLGEVGPVGPYIALQRIDDGEYRVVEADGGLLWSDFVVTGCERVPTEGVLPGDRLEGCVEGATIAYQGHVIWTG